MVYAILHIREFLDSGSFLAYYITVLDKWGK